MQDILKTWNVPNNISFNSFSENFPPNMPQLQAE